MLIPATERGSLILTKVVELRTLNIECKVHEGQSKAVGVVKVRPVERPLNRHTLFHGGQLVLG